MKRLRRDYAELWGFNILHNEDMFKLTLFAFQGLYLDSVFIFVQVTQCKLRDLIVRIQSINYFNWNIFCQAVTLFKY